MTHSPHTLRPESLVQHGEWMRALSIQRLGGPECADDWAQETCHAALDTAPLTDRLVRPWLAGVMRELLRMGGCSSARRAQRERAMAEKWTPLPVPAAQVDGIEPHRSGCRRRGAEGALNFDEPCRSANRHRVTRCGRQLRRQLRRPLRRPLGRHWGGHWDGHWDGHWGGNRRSARLLVGPVDPSDY